MQPNNPLTDLNIRSVLVCYVYARLKRWVFNLDLNWQSVSASRTVLGRLFQSLGTKQEKDLPPAVDFDILGIIKWPEFWERSRRGGL